MNEEISMLKEIIVKQAEEIENLKSRIISQDLSLESLTFKNNFDENHKNVPEMNIKRYSRQLIIPNVGMKGQLALKNSSVLIVGAGGLGCPAAQYLAAAGIGKIGIVDYDTIDVSNLNRQIAYSEKHSGQSKCLSLIRFLNELNPDVNYVPYKTFLNSKNIEKIILPYDIIIDATDNMPTRYLLNDAAVLYNKPLVSGSALKFEGQLTIYNYLDGPCYRCLFPVPTTPECVTNCSEGGILGAITGVIGSLQALEAIKIAIGIKPSYYKKLLLFDGLSGDIRVIQLRSKRSNCEICGDMPSVNKLIDYEKFCNMSATDVTNSVSLLSNDEQISCTEYKNILDSGINHILLDVRPPHEIEICHLPNIVNIPLNEIVSLKSISKLQNLVDQKNSRINYVICRRGNDSQVALRLLQEHIKNAIWYDIRGGLYSWHEEVDSSFPLY